MEVGYRQSRYLIRWREGAWALLVLLAAVLIACGLADAFTFIVQPPSYPVGHRLVLMGATLAGIFLIPAAVIAMLLDLLSTESRRPA